MTTKHTATDWLAFFAVVLIWSTTPLGIIISSQSVDPFLSLAIRMSISLLVLAVWFVITKRKIPYHRDAWLVYVAAGIVGIGFSMSFAYQAAQTLPSSWMALIFGLTPIFTGILEVIVFRKIHLSKKHWLGISLSFFGLGLVVTDPTHPLGDQLLHGAMFMIMATALHALSASMIKRIPTALAPIDTVMGSLLFAIPIVLIFWWLNGAVVPHQIDEKTILSILYLGIIGSLAGFLLYYQVLKVFSATMSSFVTLLAPPLALVWAAWLNHELLGWSLIVGAIIILIGLTIFIREPADNAV